MSVRRRSARILGIAVLLGLAFVAAPLAAPRAVGADAAAAHASSPARARTHARASRSAAVPIYRNPRYSFAERATDLVSRMTLAEKASQMDSSYSPAIPRLGVPQWGWWNEALHGVSRETLTNGANPLVLTNTTSYPDDQSLGSTWDPGLIYSVASQISSEAREVVRDNTEDLDFYSPTMNLERDPRWGRTDEAYGEDPLLVSKEVGAYVDGLQGETPAGRLPASAHGYLKTVATIKHFTAYNNEDNRLTGSSNEDPRTLEEYDTAPFRDVVRSSDPGAVMSSYNEVNGTPSPADGFLNSTLLRQTFGFQGYLTSDCDAVYEITAGHHWQPPGYRRPVTATERGALANAAGEDLNCNEGYHDAYDYGNTLPADATEQIPTPDGIFSVQDMDTSLVRLFTARMRTGEFDPARTVPWVTQARRSVPRGTWTSSNANGARTETPARLALARRAADESIVLLKNAAGNAHGASGTLLPLQVPSAGPYRVAVVGPSAHPAPADLYLGDYASTQARAGQRHDVDAYTGIRDEVRAADPSARVDYIRGFTGTAPATPQDVAHVDRGAIARIKRGGYDAVIVVTGTDGTTESAQCTSCGTESTDRRTLTLPGRQNALINDIAAVNPHTIVYMQTLGPMDVSAFAPNVSAILWSSYNAQRQGQALADVLTGATDPSGHLSATWYRSLHQIPESTADYGIRPGPHSPGRTYQYYDGRDGSVRYPFGYGLSYTSFAVSDLRLGATRVSANGTVRASATVTNTGTRRGREVVQLYAAQPNAPAAAQRPIKRLEGFAAAELAPGASRTVHFTLPVRALAYWDTARSRWTVDDGVYALQVGTSSAAAATRLSRPIDVHGRLTPRLSVVTAQPVAASDPARGIEQRVIYPEDVDVTPQLTVTTSDDRRHGFLRPGARAPLPAGTTVRYTSDHPGVVGVAGGRIRTRAAGVATITATVHLAGVTRRTSFVVRVVSQLDRLRVGGRSVPGFHPDDGDYDVIVARGAPIPRLAAHSPDPRATVTVSQPTAIPGTGTVTVTETDGVSTGYAVHLARPARSAHFAGHAAAAPAGFAFLRPAASAVSAGDGTLRIRELPGALGGAVLDPKTGEPRPTRPVRNLLLEPALGDWTIASRVSVAPATADGRSAGVIAYQGPGDYLSLGPSVADGKPAIVETVSDTRSGTEVPETLATIPTAGHLHGDAVWLRLIKRGARYTSSYSTDGRAYHVIGTYGASLTNVRVGVFAAGGTPSHAGPVASFAGFAVSGRSAPSRR